MQNVQQISFTIDYFKSPNGFIEKLGDKTPKMHKI